LNLNYDSIETLDKKSNPKLKEYKSVIDYLEQQPKIYQYEIIDLNDDENDKNVQLETNIAQIGWSK
jgi:hypothetical protein